MPRKEYPLSIVVRTVDRATAPLRKINSGINSIIAPVRRLRRTLKALGREAGLGKLARAAGGVGRRMGGLAKQVGAIGVAAGFGVAGIMRIVATGDDLAKLSDRLGMSVDAFAQLRFAAGQSGTGADDFATAMQGLSKRTGEAKANTGSMITYLRLSNKELLKQVQASSTTEEAFSLIAGAIDGLADPSKKAALASAAFGRSGKTLLNMFASGTVGIKKMREEYLRLAGPQNVAARNSEKMTDAIGRVGAASDGIKAALVSGLAPAFLEVSRSASEFLSGHRVQIAQWAQDFGRRLPGYLDTIRTALGSAVDYAGRFVDAIGGGRNAAIALGIVLNGPLIAAIANLGLALMTTPFGIILIGVAAVYEAVTHWDDITRFASRLWNDIVLIFDTKLKWLKYLMMTMNPVAWVAVLWRPLTSFFSVLWSGIAGIFSGWWGPVKAIMVAISPVAQIIAFWGPISEFFAGLWDGVTGAFEAAWKIIKTIADKIAHAGQVIIDVKNAIRGHFDSSYTSQSDQTSANMSADKKFYMRTGSHIGGLPAAALYTPPSLGPSIMSQSAAPASQRQRSEISVTFANMPKGARVETTNQGPGVDLLVGHQMGPSL